MKISKILTKTFGFDLCMFKNGEGRVFFIIFFKTGESTANRDNKPVGTI